MNHTAITRCDWEGNRDTYADRNKEKISMVAAYVFLKIPRNSDVIKAIIRGKITRRNEIK
jgi:hypothetical protein